MTIKKDGRGRTRDYKKEYKRDHSPKKDKKERACRTEARSMINAWLKDRGKPPLKSSQTVDHKDGNPCNNKRSNLKIVSQGENSTKSNKNRSKKS
jgi:hypothetical protein|tara:strand:+ start:3317 stop:3601 length:285 start_codon:yes stop_codon:yes gene_type:complete